MAIDPKNPQVMCAQCQHIFPSDAGENDVVTCPVCGYSGKPGGMMKISSFPDAEQFKRNYQASQRLEPSNEPNNEPNDS